MLVLTTGTAWSHLMADSLPIRVHAIDSTLVLRDGIVFVLFVPASHREISPGVARVFERYLMLSADHPPTLILDRGESYRTFTPKALAMLNRHLAKGSDRYYIVTVRDGKEPTVPEYFFQYAGEAINRNAASVSYLEMWFPTELLSAIGTNGFVQALKGMAEELPFASGYCSIALNYEDWVEAAASTFIRGAALRLPGLDVRNSMGVAHSIGNLVRNAYWLTFLGTAPLAVLRKDAASLQSDLGPEILVHSQRNGVAIQAGAMPEVGDINRLEVLPLVRRVARLIQPVAFEQTIAVAFDNLEDDLKWQKRHIL